MEDSALNIGSFIQMVRYEGLLEYQSCLTQILKTSGLLNSLWVFKNKVIQDPAKPSRMLALD